MLRRTGRVLLVLALYGLVVAAGFWLGGNTGLAIAFLMVLVVESRRARRRAIGGFPRRTSHT